MSTESPQPLTVTTDQRGVTTITLDDQDRRNALSGTMINALVDAIHDASQDHTVRAVVVTNAGNTFCAGADISGKPSEAPRYNMPDLFAAIQNSPKPVIGRVAGHCTGGGVGLAAACDVSFMADDAVLAFTEVRIGVVPAMIAVVCLPKMRRGDALELFLSGERVSAERAADVGLINHAVTRGELDEEVETFLGKVLRGGPVALGVSKEVIFTLPRLDPEEAVTWTHETSMARFASDEAKEGMSAFREKRDPAWVTPSS